jgi:hypothetical protein
VLQRRKFRGQLAPLYYFAVDVEGTRRKESHFSSQGAKG